MEDNYNDSIKQADFTQIEVNAAPIEPATSTVEEKPIIEPKPEKPAFDLQAFIKDHNKSKKRRRRTTSIVIVVLIVIIGAIFGGLFVKGLDNMSIPQEIVVEYFNDNGYVLSTDLQVNTLQTNHPNLYQMGVRRVLVFEKTAFPSEKIFIYYFEEIIQAMEAYNTYDINQDENIPAASRARYTAKHLSDALVIGTSKAMNLMDPPNKEKWAIIMDYKSK